MPTFNYSFTVDAPLAAVAKFHLDPGALKKLSPGPMKLHRTDPMGEGSITEFTIWLGPIPIHWRAVHSDVSENGFSDRQESGPMEFWAHRHQFSALNETQTRINEQIEYRHPKGMRGLFTRLLFSKPGLKILFTYRQWSTKLALRREK